MEKKGKPLKTDHDKTYEKVPNNSKKIKIPKKRLKAKLRQPVLKSNFVKIAYFRFSVCV